LTKLGGEPFVYGGRQESVFAIRVWATAETEEAALAIFRELEAKALHSSQAPDVPRLPFDWVDNNRCEGNQIILIVDAYEVWPTFPQLMAYLEKRNCTKLEYSLITSVD
jgi:hypothetical protein